MKTCTKCGVEKALDRFHVSQLGAQGRTAACKECRKTAASIRYGHQRSQIIEKTRKYREEHPDDVRRWSRERYYRDPEAAKDAQREARSREPNKAKARNAVDKAVLAGRLVKPDTCADCRTAGLPLDGHHESYDPSRWLDVVWLCRRCHLRLHADRRAA